MFTDLNHLSEVYLGLLQLLKHLLLVHGQITLCQIMRTSRCTGESIAN